MVCRFGPVGIRELIIVFLVVLNVKQNRLLLFDCFGVCSRFVFLKHFADSQLRFDLLGLHVPLENNSQPDLGLARYEHLSHVVDDCQEHLRKGVKKGGLQREAPSLLLEYTRVSFFVLIFDDVEHAFHIEVIEHETICQNGYSRIRTQVLTF